MSHFELEHHSLNLQLKQVFTISRGSKSSVENVIVHLTCDDITGMGEAAPNTRYSEDARKVKLWLNRLPEDFFEEIKTPDDLAIKLDSYSASPAVDPVKSARSAVEMAWLDWWGKKQEQPLWKLWKASSNRGPVTSFTIGLDELDRMQQKVRGAAEYPILKVKLGTERDRAIIKSIREVTDKPLRIDANEGWNTLDEAKAAIDFLADQNVQMIEQPMPADRFDDLVQLKKNAPIPLCADESFEGDEDLEEIARAFDIINIKLAKIGSMVRAKQVIDRAKPLGLEVMIGCMIESSLADTAGAVLSLWADYADLDGHLLIADDPFEGLKLDEDKRITLPARPGLGVRKV